MKSEKKNFFLRGKFSRFRKKVQNPPESGSDPVQNGALF